jgi:hypothetical protein
MESFEGITGFKGDGSSGAGIAEETHMDKYVAAENQQPSDRSG